jgi:hypothetical protein
MKYTATSSGNGEFTFRIEDGEFKDISIRVGNLRYANSTLEYDFDVYGGEISDESVGEYITLIYSLMLMNFKVMVLKQLRSLWMSEQW